ncbi:MAG: sugar-binding protein, partial [Candidatus Poribacteria bacterium]
SPFLLDEVDASVTAQGGARRTVRLVETGPATGVFRGVAATTVIFAPSDDGAGELPLRGGEVVDVTYRDPLVGTGETDVEVTASCRARRVGAAPYTDERIIIDGIPERWPLENAMAAAEGGVLVWAQWGRDALYVFAEVADDDVTVADVTRWHEGSDALELHIALDIDRQGSPAHLLGSSASEYVFWICPTGGGLAGDEPYVGRAQPSLAPNYGVVEVAALRTGAGYSLEARIPFHTALPGFDPITSARRDRLGFNYLLYRSSAPQVWWSPLNTPASQAGQAGILYLDRPGS